jgi:hypothetical protein
MSVDGAPAWLTEDTLALGDDVATEFLQILEVPDRGNQLVRRAVGGLSPHDERVSPAIASHLNRGTVAALPDGGFVVAYRYVSRLDFYRPDLTRSNAARGPVEVPLVYNSGVPSIVPGGPAATNAFHKADTRWTYVDVDVANDIVYALFSGRAWGGDGPLHLSSSIHRFTLDGTPLGMLGMPTEVYAIDVDLDTQIMYALRQSPPGIVEFRLPD